MANCKSCGAYILWVKMDSGRMMPVNKATKPMIHIGPDNIGSIVHVYESHFATCPNADQHRQKKKG